MPRDVHVVRPDHEGERADDHDRPDHHAVAEDVLARVDADQVGDDAEGGQRDDVDLRVAEEPEQVLEQDRAAAAVGELLAHLDQRRHEEAGAEQPVEHHHHAGDEERREGEHRHDGGGEDAPDRQRHPHQRHAAGAALQHGHDVVEAAHGEADDEEHQRGEHQEDAGLLAAGRAAEDRLRRIERPARPGRAARREEARDQHEDRQQVDPVAEHVDVGKHHVPGADHQRDQVVAEAAEEERGQQVHHHDHAVHGDELVVGLRRDEVEEAGKAELQPDQPGEHQRDQADADRGAGILQRDDLGVLREDVGRPPALRVVELDLRNLGRRDAGVGLVCCVDHSSSSVPAPSRSARRPHFLPVTAWVLPPPVVSAATARRTSTARPARPGSRPRCRCARSRA